MLKHSTKGSQKWFLHVLWIFLLDKLSKFWVLHHIHPGEPHALFPNINLILTHNFGIAFSLFNRQSKESQLALLFFILLLCIILTVWLIKTPWRDQWQGWALTLILGGALGNVSDRFQYGYVIDFIDFYIGNWHWYTFNLADSFITLGALMLVKTILFSAGEERR